MVKVIKGLIVIFLLTTLSTGAQAATLHGTIYEWSDFEKPLKNALVEVNSTPAQYVVAKTGTYSFNLSPGTYLIKAKYFRDNILEYSAEEEIQIERDGDFVHDLLLFPPTESEYDVLGDINLTSVDIEAENYTSIYTVPILILISSAFVIIYRFKKKKIHAKSENIAEPEKSDLPQDLRDLYEIILEMGGRTTQKELRKKIKYSEAKVSLMVTDLEDRGFIKKIKKGRSNIIIAHSRK